MRRRAFISLFGAAAAAWPLAAQAQQADKPIRIGFIGASLNSSGMAAQYQAFLTELNEFGFSDGKNIVVDYRRLDDPNARGPFAIAPWRKAARKWCSSCQARSSLKAVLRLRHW